ncbi:DUF4386 family protein [Phenylobacterium sp.]|uniref:DUF4386 family protein n=1 Tax=Phenylobacterium sp. TaxID=1871053 RepID=UPI00271C6594|nr:DUF4386 family protein [Phenylobacterium sp.]MDO8381247.1 DUF4386 family protein [Phenylobacterium sp.]
MTRFPDRLLAGLTLIGFLGMANVAYAYLVALFGYDDVLREPVGVVLSRFAAGGPALVLAWAGFAWSALIFVLAAALLGRALAREHGQSVWIATAAGAASGLIQAVGLLRWVFVVPSLAAGYGAPGASQADRVAVAQIYNALNQYGGVALGEHLGQMLLLAWSVGIIAACWRIGGALRWTSLLGLASLPLWILGQTELFATVAPDIRVFETTPLAFMIWMAWILALAVSLIVQRPRPHPAALTETLI